MELETINESSESRFDTVTGGIIKGALAVGAIAGAAYTVSAAREKWHQSAQAARRGEIEAIDHKALLKELYGSEEKSEKSEKSEKGEKSGDRLDRLLSLLEAREGAGAPAPTVVERVSASSDADVRLDALEHAQEEMLKEMSNLEARTTAAITNQTNRLLNEMPDLIARAASGSVVAGA